MKESIENKFSSTTKIFQPKLLKLRDTNNFSSNIKPNEILNYTNKNKLDKYAENSKKKLEKYDVADSVKEGNF